MNIHTLRDEVVEATMHELPVIYIRGEERIFIGGFDEAQQISNQLTMSSSQSLSTSRCSVGIICPF